MRLVGGGRIVRCAVTIPMESRTLVSFWIIAPMSLLYCSRAFHDILLDVADIEEIEKRLPSCGT